ncbi:hypothetical protein F5148DRAFT_1204170, partial [Russula earlei]
PFSPSLGNNSETYYPPNHDSLASILGLAHAYLKHLHPSKLAQLDESMKASAHLLKLFLNDTLVTALPLGHHPQSANHLTSLETTLIDLTQALVDMRKEIKALPKNTTTPTKAKVPLTPASNTTPTYAAKASLPPHPSAVMKTSAYTWPASLCPNPADICATINSALLYISALRWTQKGNLVIWGGPNTMAHNLMTSLPAISEALQASLSVNSISAPQEPPPVRPNVKWSKLTINAAPTGKTNTREAYTPQECHQTLLAENPTYATLTITQTPIMGPGTPLLAHPTHAWACETPHPKTSNPQPNWRCSHPKHHQPPAQPHSPCPTTLHQTGLPTFRQNTTFPHALDTGICAGDTVKPSHTMHEQCSTP